MAATDRDQSAALDLLAALRSEPSGFDFFQALRRLECAYPERPRLGQSVRPAEDPIRLGQEPSMAFAASALAGIKPGRGGGVPSLMVNCFGLLGPNGPMPLHLTEYARDRIRNVGDTTFCAFLDLFHHRMLSLLYRAWADAQPTVHFDRPGSDRFACYVGSLFGAGAESDGRHSDPDALPHHARLFFAGRAASLAPSAEGLRDMIAEFFGLPSRVEQFSGHWVALPPECHTRLGQSPETGTLGSSAVAGTSVWDRQSRFCIILGPLPGTEFERMLPGNPSLRRLVSLVQSYIGEEYSWDLRLVIEKCDITATQLGSGQRLGWTSWLCGQAAPGADCLTLDGVARSSRPTGSTAGQTPPSASTQPLLDQETERKTPTRTPTP